MAGNSKPRKRYKGAQNIRPPRQSGPAILNSVRRDVALNPVARAVELAKLTEIAGTLEASVLILADGSHQPVVIDDCIQRIDIAKAERRIKEKGRENAA